MERPMEKPPFRLHSPAFSYGGIIPKEYTADGQGMSPPLTIEHPPEDTAVLALSLEDQGAPGGAFIYWRLWNIPSQTRMIRENASAHQAIVGKNSDGTFGYLPLRPPMGEHSYTFRLFALRHPLTISPESSPFRFESALIGNVIAEVDLVGYSHHSPNQEER